MSMHALSSLDPAGRRGRGLRWKVMGRGHLHKLWAMDTQAFDVHLEARTLASASLTVTDAKRRRSVRRHLSRKLDRGYPVDRRETRDSPLPQLLFSQAQPTQAMLLEASRKRSPDS